MNKSSPKRKTKKPAVKKPTAAAIAAQASGLPPRISKRGRVNDGRPTKYRPEYCEKIIEYFSVDLSKTHKKTVTFKNGTTIEEEVFDVPILPTIAGFSADNDFSKEDVHEWCKKYPDFQRAVIRAKQMAEQVLVTHGLLGNYDSAFARFVAINYTDMRDRTDHAFMNPDGSPLGDILSRIDGKTRGLPSGKEEKK